MNEIPQSVTYERLRKHPVSWRGCRAARGAEQGRINEPESDGEAEDGASLSGGAYGPPPCHDLDETTTVPDASVCPGINNPSIQR